MFKRRFFISVAAGAIVLGAMSLGIRVPSSSIARADTAAGDQNQIHKDWKLVFDQDFSKITALDPKIWNIVDKGGGFGNNELEYYSPNNLKIENGELVITGKKENYKGSKYTSGKITTEGKISFQYGRIEACIKAPKAQQGNWPAFWMLGDNIGQVGWPRCGEIDIMELINKSDTLYATMHGGTAKHDQNKYTLSDGKDFSDDYHVYAVEWEKEKSALTATAFTSARLAMTTRSTRNSSSS